MDRYHSKSKPQHESPFDRSEEAKLQALRLRELQKEHEEEYRRNKPRRILRRKQVCERLGIGRTALDQNYIRTGKLKKIPLGLRAVGFSEEAVDRLIAELIAESEGGA